MNRRRFLSLAAVPALAMLPKLRVPVVARKADVLTYPLKGCTLYAGFTLYGGGRRVGKTMGAVSAAGYWSKIVARDTMHQLTAA